MLLSVLGCLWLLVTYFIKKRKEDPDTEEENTEEEKRSHGILRLLSLLFAFMAIITFILTEDVSLSMVMTDNWTVLMLLFAIIQVVFLLLARKNTDK